MPRLDRLQDRRVVGRQNAQLLGLEIRDFGLRFLRGRRRIPLPQAAPITTCQGDRKQATPAGRRTRERTRSLAIRRQTIDSCSIRLASRRNHTLGVPSCADQPAGGATPTSAGRIRTAENACIVCHTASPDNGDQSPADGPKRCSVTSIAFSSPWALFSVSWYSAAGTLSATMPAPACT